MLNMIVTYEYVMCDC